MKIRTKLQITQKHIDKGRKCALQFCPIALAIKETFKIRRVWVSGTEIELNIKEHFLFADMPQKAQDFVNKFDIGNKVKPFSFVLKAESDI